MSLSLFSIASGSKGNCYLIASGHTLLMSDCGISFKKAAEGLSALGFTRPDALLLTHSHTDHVRSAALIAKTYDIPVYLTAGTAGEVPSLSDLPLSYIAPGTPFTVGGITAEAFSVSHDTAEPVAYTYSDGGDKASVMTDTGIVTGEMEDKLRGSSSVIIESNHDEKMLKNGPYPPFLKARILGEYGHLENGCCARLCRLLSESGTSRFLLAHLSEHNNTPALARSATEAALSGAYTLKIADSSTPLAL